MRKVFYLLACAALFTGCSEDKEINPNTNTAAVDRIKSEVPRDRLIYDALGKAGDLSLNELIELYKEDINTAEADYLTNLKNMWLTILNPRIYKDGTEEQKLFCITEQLTLNDNLAHFTGFYNILATSKIDRAVKERIADSYYERNLEAIADVQWANLKEEKNKQMELIYAKRTFQNLLNTPR